MLKIQRNFQYCIIICILMLLCSISCFAKTKPIMTTDLLQNLKKGEPWDKRVLTATKMVMFQQTASGGTDASSISKITLAYFTTADCSGTKAGSGFYTTPNGTSFAINQGSPFGMVANSVSLVGTTQLGIADITTIQSIAVTFKSTNNNTPQSNFSGVNFTCVPVTCTGSSSGQCTSTSGTQGFTLKTTAAIGDPADGGVIACTSSGTLVASTRDNNNQIPIVWGGSGTTTGATSTTDGSANTTTIVNRLGSGSTYAARVCSTYSANGGYTSGWFLPAGNNTGSTAQLNCLYNNRTVIGNFSTNTYWSSTEGNSTLAYRQSFSNGTQGTTTKTSTSVVRCVRSA